MLARAIELTRISDLDQTMSASGAENGRLNFGKSRQEDYSKDSDIHYLFGEAAEEGHLIVDDFLFVEALRIRFLLEDIDLL